MPSPLLSIHGLQVQFHTRRGILNAVNDASFKIYPGEVYGIVGESGSGKSVTALTTLGLLPSTAEVVSGHILFNNRNLLEFDDAEMRAIRGKEIGFVFQDPQASFDPVFTIANQIGEAITIHRKQSKGELHQRIEKLLKSVGIQEVKARKNQYPHQFSGGMKQRAMLAMAIANNPALIIADEPTTSLDVTIQAQVIDLLLSLKNRLGIAVLLITHDMGLIAELCDRVSVMYAGYIVESAGVNSIFNNPHHPYTQGLLASVPSLDVYKNNLESIPGRVPDPTQSYAHCIFQPRCRYAEQACMVAMPRLKEVETGIHVACFRMQGKNS
jgi:oligopeptide/dipeptide ABC transporter ATP-binding protein